MDDTSLNKKSTLYSMKGKTWSSLQNIVDSEDSEENDSIIYCNTNGYISPINALSNGSSTDDFHRFKSSLNEPSDTMKLKKEDMNLYGFRPAWDQFYLVVCEYCGQVIKPQALTRHIELRHKKVFKTISTINKTKNSLTDEISESNSNNDNEYCLKKLLVSNIQSTDDISSDKSEKNIKSVLNKSIASSKKNESKSYSSSSTASSSPLALSENSFKKIAKGKFLPCKDRKYDPDKHCGVKLSELDAPCTRSLTCKTHSLTLRRSVPGRSNLFDNLLLEHRLSKEAALRAAGVEIKPTKQQMKQQQKNYKDSQNNLKDLSSEMKNSDQFPNNLLSTNQSPQLLSTTAKHANGGSSTFLNQKKHYTNDSNLYRMLNGQKQNSPNNKNNDNSANRINLNQLNYSNSNFNNETLFSSTSNNCDSTKQFQCDASLYSLNHHPRPAAICTFNARRLSLNNNQSGNDEDLLSSRVFNRKKDFTYSALSIFCNNNNVQTSVSSNLDKNCSGNFLCINPNRDNINKVANVSNEKQLVNTYTNSNLFTLNHK